jgi:cytochrome c oxidase subunit 6a
MLRTTQRFATKNLRSPVVRRRFASHAESQLKGVENNAFNKEREAVKAHAAATSGMLFF